MSRKTFNNNQRKNRAIVQKWTTRFILALVLVAGTISGWVFAQQVNQPLIHWIDRQPSQTDPLQFDVSIHFSVLDPENKIQKNLQASDLKVFENGALRKIALGNPTSQPVNLILVIDRGSGMKGKLKDVISVIPTFFESLPSGSKVKILSYVKETEVKSDWTSELDQLTTLINEIPSPDNSASCFYRAIQTSLQQSIENTVVLFILNAKDASIYKESTICPAPLEDIKTEFKEHSNPPRYYFIHYGDDFEEEVFTDLIQLTSALFLRSSETLELVNWLESLQPIMTHDQVITFTSFLPKDKVQVQLCFQTQSCDYFGDRPEILPPQVYFGNIQDGQVIPVQNNAIFVYVQDGSFQGQKLVYSVNDVLSSEEKVLSLNTPEERLELKPDLTPYIGLPVTLVVSLQDATDHEIAQASVKFSVEEQVMTPTLVEETIQTQVPLPTSTIPTPPIQEETNENPKETTIFLIILLSSFFLAGGVFGYMYIKNKKMFDIKKIKLNQNFFNLLEKYLKRSEENSANSFVSTNDLYQLQILDNPDLSMINRVIHVTVPEFSIGRDVSNSLPIPLDTRVSRKHVLLIAKNGSVQLIEYKKNKHDGNLVGPLHGTFVEGKRVVADTRLYSGNVINLGPNTKLLISIYETEI